MRPYQSNQEDEDPDIKKIKKVGCWGFPALGEHGDQWSFCSDVFATLTLSWEQFWYFSSDGSQTCPSEW